MKNMSVQLRGNKCRHVSANKWFFENFGFHCCKEWSENKSKFNLFNWF